MNKVICDVCGTAYPETSTQCPICGSAKVVNDQTAAGASSEESSYSYVKGGRFSKRNVRRRTGKASRPEQRVSAQKQEQAEEEETSKALIVVVIVLLLCIVAVAVYLGVRYFIPAANNNGVTNPPATTEPTQEPTDADIPCTSITVTHGFVDLLEEGDIWEIEYTLEPGNTTDKVTFESSNEEVAIVLDDGTIFAVGPGEAEITVKCGDAEYVIYVNCLFVEDEPTEEPTQPDDPDVGPGVDPGVQFVFNCHYKFDVTLKAGQTWNAFDKTLGIEATDVLWSVADPSICTVDANGVVTTLKAGKTNLIAVWNGATYKCVVRVS